MAWNLVQLRAETLSVPYLNDSSVHEQMVRSATALIRSGHLPLTSWFPFLGLGSPQFLHYQSLPAMLTGVAGLVVGPDVAFRWSLYLLLSLWPVSVYLGARRFGLPRSAAAAAAAMAPFLSSATGVGYEQGAYVWIGYGVWTQLWASMTLPLAWGYSWRALRDGRGYAWAVGLIALTVALHFETGYLALFPLIVWPFVVSRKRWVPAVRRGALLLGGALLASAWVIVPLLAQREWASTNEPLKGSADVNGYGAGRVLGWLVSGQLLDHVRLPVLTVCAVVGLVLACGRARRDPNARALLVALVICLLLTFGRATWGSLVGVIPGAGDLFFRRFQMGVQLVSLLLAGAGVAWVGDRVWEWLGRGIASLGWEWPRGGLAGWWWRPLAGVVALAVLLAPAWVQLGRFDAVNSSEIHAQRAADAVDVPQLDRVLRTIRSMGPGRVFAGSPSTWGDQLTVGQVPVFKYLESVDIDEVGYTLRTASLMTDPEFYFDSTQASDFKEFGIRYVILPPDLRPLVPAVSVMDAGPYGLWTIPSNGYVSVGRVVGSYAANRTDIGARSLGVLQSALAQDGEYLRVRFGGGGGGAGPAAVPAARLEPPVGRVVATDVALTSGVARATVSMKEPGVVVLSASFDPGWQATVDGRRVPTEMVAPALVGVAVPAGTHAVVFRYVGFGGYVWLLALLVAVVLALIALDTRAWGPMRSRRRAARAGGVRPPSQL